MVSPGAVGGAVSSRYEVRQNWQPWTGWTAHQVLIEFETKRTAPVKAMQAAHDAKEDMLPAFLAELERASQTP